MTIRRRSRTEKLLLVDYSNLLHRALHAYKNLSYKGEFTGGVFGMVKMLTATIDEYMPSRVIICKDKRPYLRSSLYPEYKAKRVKDDSEEWARNFATTETWLLRLFLLSNIPTWTVEGFEADDLIAHLVLKYQNRFSKIIIQSNDTDLEQLHFMLPRRVNFIMKRAGTLVMNRKQIMDKYNLPRGHVMNMEKFLLIHALAGTHNDVKGVQGVGVKTGMKIVQKQKMIDAAYQHHSEVIERNKQLIRLPHPELKTRLQDNPRHRPRMRPPGIKTEKEARQVKRLLSDLGIAQESQYFINCLSFQHLRGKHVKRSRKQ